MDNTLIKTYPGGGVGMGLSSKTIGCPTSLTNTAFCMLVEMISFLVVKTQLENKRNRLVIRGEVKTNKTMSRG